MKGLDFDLSCPECSKRYVDAGDELVCPFCGRTKEKEAVQTRAEEVPQGLTPKQALGSFMGSRGITKEERRSRGIGGSGSRYEYLKVVSDFAGRNEGAPAVCTRLIERMSEKLFLPRVVCLEAASIARKVFATSHPHRRITIAAASAYALITACKLEGVTSVSVREIMDAHAALGRRVTLSSIIKLTLDSTVKTYTRGPEAYLMRVVARMTMNQRLQDRLARDGINQNAFATSLRLTAQELLQFVNPEARAGRRPSALAGSAVYSAELVLSRCDARRRRLTQRDLAECGDTAEYTIREQCAQIFAPFVEELVRRRQQPLSMPEAR
jgi:transcription initiation factor TFIIIB Brf1 subunit/transcription initiation factor TFIIB